jgi:hypothetical protein
VVDNRNLITAPYNILYGGVNMTELEKGYLAGIIDGEGSVTLAKDK